MNLKLSIMIHYLLVFAVSLCGYLHADVINLVANGYFETGDLTGWVSDQQNPTGIADGYWDVYSGNSVPDLPPPPEGIYAAYSNTLHISSMVLYQDIELPAGSSLTLQYIYYYHNNSASAFFSPQTLAVSRSFPNQQARIDIMDPAAPPFSVNAGEVWLNLFQTQPGDPQDVAPTTASFDLSPFAGQTIRLRFAVASSQGILNLGVDAVVIASEIDNPVSPPESLRGSVFKNRFLTQTDRINHLQWLPSPTLDVVVYYVYRNGRLIAKIPSTAPLMYDDHNRSKKTDVYSVVAVNEEGIESEPATVTLP